MAPTKLNRQSIGNGFAAGGRLLGNGSLVGAGILVIRTAPVALDGYQNILSVVGVIAVCAGLIEIYRATHFKRPS